MHSLHYGRGPKNNRCCHNRWQRKQVSGGSDLNHQVNSKLTRAQISLGGPVSYGSYAVKTRMEKIDETLDLRGKRVLDLGCGNGCYTQELACRAAYVCGIDIQMSHLKAFRQPIERIQAAGENLPLRSDSFDVVTMIEVLEHTRSDEQTLEECFRVLKPGGLLVLFVPNKLYPFESHPCHISSLQVGPNIPLISWLPESLHKRLCYARIYTRRNLLAMTNRAGFQTKTIGYIFPPLDSLHLPFKQTYRKAVRWFGNSPLSVFGVSIYAVFQKPRVLKEEIQPVRPTADWHPDLADEKQATSYASAV